MNFLPYLIAVLAIAGAAGWEGDRIGIASQQPEIGRLRDSIDGPSGYVAQLGAVNAKTAQVRDNLKTCQASLDLQNGKLATLAADAARKQAATAAALNDLAASQRSASQLVAAIASFKSTANTCVDADNILKLAGH